VRAMPMVPPVKPTRSDDPDRGSAQAYPPGLAAASGERERLLAAVAETLAEFGYAGLTVERVVAVADLPPASFEANFDDSRAAVVAAQEFFFERFIALLLHVCAAQQEWPLKVKVAIGASLDFAAASPAQALLLDLDALTADRSIARRAIEAKDRLASLLAEGRRHSDHGAELPSLTEQGIVAALAGTVSPRLIAGEARHLPELAPQLVQIALLPYLGREEAARVATRPRPGAAG
jgi:AcrR family transcriptional regulator